MADTFQRMVAANFLACNMKNLVHNLILLDSIAIKGVERQNIWIGLTDPDQVACQSSVCDSKLSWIDGSPFIYYDCVMSQPQMLGYNEGLTFWEHDDLFNDTVFGGAPYICEFLCGELTCKCSFSACNEITI